MPIPSSPVDRISAAMTISSLQGQVIAGNIANRDVPGYQRIALSFERALDGSSSPSVVADDRSPAVSLEQDLVDLAANTARYTAMARVVSRYFSIVSVISNSRR